MALNDSAAKYPSEPMALSLVPYALLLEVFDSCLQILVGVKKI
jgi:hypothetical protein